MTSPQAKLSIQQLSIWRQKTPLLAIDEDIAAGEILTVMGPSGSGKSTLLNWVSGMMNPVFTAKGKLVLNGNDITELPSHLRQIAVLYQDPLLFNHLTVAGNIAFAMRSGNKEGRRQRISEALESVGLGGMESRWPNSLSGGQQARVALLRVLLNEPKVLLLDEPFSKLDSQLRQDIREIVFAQIRERKLPAILVTHDQQDANATAGKVINLALPQEASSC